jgi:hypothetical protein
MFLLLLLERQKCFTQSFEVAEPCGHNNWPFKVRMKCSTEPIPSSWRTRDRRNDPQKTNLPLNGRIAHVLAAVFVAQLESHAQTGGETAELRVHALPEWASAPRISFAGPVSPHVSPLTTPCSDPPQT